MGRLCRIVYCSRSRLTGSRADIEMGIRRILAAARQRNNAARLTGALTFTDSCFAQVLEGDLDDLAPVFTSIRRDPRHIDVKMLEQIESGFAVISCLVDGICGHVRRGCWTPSPGPFLV